MSQQVFADRLGKSKSWVDKVERGVRRLDKFSLIHDIAQVLQVDPQLLLGQELHSEPTQRTTVAVSSMSFLRPVPVGATVSCYAEQVEVGRSSIRIVIEVWIKETLSREIAKVTEGEFVYVAIDDNGRTRAVPRS